MFEWIWYVKFACVMFGCWVIFLEKYNFHIVFSMVYESIVNDVNGSIASSGILWNVDSIVLKVFCMVNSVYFVQDNSLNNYFHHPLLFHLFNVFLKWILWNITVWNDFWYRLVIYYVSKWFGTLGSSRNIKFGFLFRKISLFSHIINGTWLPLYIEN